MGKKTRFNIAVTCLIVFLGFVLAALSMFLREQDLRRNFLRYTEFVAQSVDWDTVRQLNGSQADSVKPEYAALKRLLVRVAVLRADCRFVYVLGQRPDKSIFFYADSESETSRDYSPPGQLFPEASSRLLRAFADGVPVVEGPVSDRWGVWISALVPLRRYFSGDPVPALLGIDIDFLVWCRELIYAGLVPFMGMLLVAAFFLLWRFKFEYHYARLNLECSRDELLNAQKKYEFFIKHSLEGVLAIDKTSRVNFVNQQLADLLGYTPEEMIGKQADDFIPLEEQADHHRKVAERVIGTTDKYERTLLRKDGSRLFALISAVPMRNEKGIITGSYAMIMDITANKLADAALRESREQHRLFIDATDDLVFLKNASLSYVIVNKAYQAFLGKIEQEIIGKTDAELLPEDVARNCRRSDETARGSESAVVTLEYVGGKTFHVRKFPVHFPDGSVGVGGVIRDIAGGK